MNYMNIKKNDIANGPGVRVSLWVSGCPHYCKGCHNYTAWNPESGSKFEIETMIEVEDALSENIKKDLSILGGEPLAPYNLETITNFLKYIKGKKPNLNIWLWTGYIYSEVCDFEIMEYIDVLVDGPYVSSLHVNGRYYGSSNQKVIDLKQTRAKGETILWKGTMTE